MTNAKSLSDELKPLKDIIELVNNKLDGVTERLDDPNTGLTRINHRLDGLWDQTGNLTEDTAQIQEKLDSHTVVLKQIISNAENTENNLHKLDKRLDLLEEDAGSEVPPELHLT